MSIIDNLNKNGDYVSKHMDKEDLVTALFHVGDPSNGGETKYYNGLTANHLDIQRKQSHVSRDNLL